jgi:hypothetical protein
MKVASRMPMPFASHRSPRLIAQLLRQNQGADAVEEGAIEGFGVHVTEALAAQSA